MGRAGGGVGRRSWVAVAVLRRRLAGSRSQSRSRSQKRGGRLHGSDSSQTRQSRGVSSSSSSGRRVLAHLRVVVAPAAAAEAAVVRQWTPWTAGTVSLHCPHAQGAVRVTIRAGWIHRVDPPRVAHQHRRGATSSSISTLLARGSRRWQKRRGRWRRDRGENTRKETQYTRRVYVNYERNSENLITITVRVGHNQPIDRAQYYRVPMPEETTSESPVSRYRGIAQYLPPFDSDGVRD